VAVLKEFSEVLVKSNADVFFQIFTKQGPTENPLDILVEKMRLRECLMEILTVKGKAMKQMLAFQQQKSLKEAISEEFKKPLAPIMKAPSFSKEGNPFLVHYKSSLLKCGESPK